MNDHALIKIQEWLLLPEPIKHQTAFLRRFSTFHSEITTQYFYGNE